MATPVVTIIEHAMEQWHVRNRAHLSGINGVHVEVLTREAENLIIDLVGYVWSQTLQDETATLEVRYPASLWQGWKLRWAPAWFLCRWPVKNSTMTAVHRFRTVALLPSFKYEAPPGTGRHIIKTFVEEVSRDVVR